MHTLIFVLMSLLCLNTFQAYANQADKAAPSQLADHATIQRRRIVLVRSNGLVKQFPHKKKATLTYPVIGGLSGPVLRRVRSMLDFKNIFDYSLQEYRDDTWLDEFSYQVNHNGNYLLDITFMQSGSAAYPDDQSKHFLINLKTGRLVKAADAFQPAGLVPLSILVNRKLQEELKEILEDLNESKSDPEDIRIAKEAQEPLEFKVEHLNDFSVGDKGVTFLYDAGYPHVIKAFEPDGQYFFSYAELKPYIKPNGPLGQFLH
ncbi:MAG TPA: hypothetical protein VK208_07385 [Pyrinomonadaceae bacterium]|jgi:hypothetical protein|nr:hypothetical protein [Pyrinomonadaceae bacterium]